MHVGNGREGKKKERERRGSEVQIGNRMVGMRWDQRLINGKGGEGRGEMSGHCIQ